MSDTAAARKENSARLKRNVTKLAFRGREKMLRTLGRGEETKDEIIDNYVHLVTKQQAQFNKFQHDMKRYLQSIAAMKLAAGEFYTSLGEIYEDDWMGKDMLGTLAKTTDLLYTDLHARLNNEVITVLQDHLTQCNEMKVKVSKRGRKLVDFDASRRALASLQGAKKLEESKLTRAQDHVTQAHDTYETLNSQLHDDLPDLYDSRVTLCTGVISNIANAEKAFFEELCEVRTKLNHVVTNVRDAFDNGEYRIQRLHSPIRNEASPKVPAPATLPADEVTGQRSRGHSERSSGDRRHSGSSSHKHNSSHRSSKHDDSGKRKRSSSNRSDKDTSAHQYVNIQVGQQSDHMTNGHDQSEEPKNEYTDVPVEEEPKPRQAEPQTKGYKHVDDKPRPSPRLKVRDVSHDRASSSTSGSVDATPQARPRTMTLPDGQAEPQGMDRAKNKSKTLDKDAGAPKQGKDEMKRRSLLSFTGLDKLFTKPPKQKTPSESGESKQKIGFFTKKDKQSTSPKTSTSEGPKPHRKAPTGPPSKSQAPAPIFQKVQTPDFRPMPQTHEPSLSADTPQFQSAGGSNELYSTEYSNTEIIPPQNSFNPDDDEDVYENVDREIEEESTHSDNLYEDMDVGFPKPHDDVTNQHDDITDQPDDVTRLDDFVGPADVTSPDDVSVSLNGSSSVSAQSTPFGSETNLAQLTVAESFETAQATQQDITHSDVKETDDFTRDFDHGGDHDEMRNDKCLEVEWSKTSSLYDFASNLSSQIDVVPSHERASNSSNNQEENHDDVFKPELMNQPEVIDNNPFEDLYDFAQNVHPPSAVDVASVHDDIKKVITSTDIIEHESAASVESDSVESDDVLSDDVKSNNADDVSLVLEAKMSPSVEDAADESADDVIPGDVSGENSPIDIRSMTSQSSVDDVTKSENNKIPTEPNQVNGGSPLNDTVPEHDEVVPSTKQIEVKTPVKEEVKADENVILPPHYLYTVQALYPYQGADDDELTFGKGDTIYVVEFPDPEEQDDGWQMGIARSTWEGTGSTSCMGVFPENFTKKS